MNPVLPALRGRQTTVAIDAEFNALGISMITIRPIRRAGDRFTDISVLNKIAKTMKSEIYRHVRPQVPNWTDPRIRAKLRFNILMYNWNNLDNATINNDMRLSYMKGTTLEQMFERATANGSNANLDLYDVIWKVWINPASLQEGGGKAETWMKGLVQSLKLRDDPGNIGCAALSIGTLIEIKNPRSKTRRDRDPIFTDRLITLQRDLNFEDPQRATVFELKKFVELYPTYRICIVQHLFTTPIVYTGSRYCKDENPDKDLTIFIYHDLRKNHFSPIHKILAFVRNMKNNCNTGFCFDCCTIYMSDVQKSSCACGSLKGKTRAPRGKRMQCTSCNHEYFKSYDPKRQHRCGESQCRFCSQFYTTEQVGSHRCPLYIAPEKLLKIFKGDENPALQSMLDEHIETKRARAIEAAASNKIKYTEKKEHQYELWVWDIESHFVFTDGTTEQFEVNENGEFELVEGELAVKHVTKLAQLGILQLT